jgi:hypothetical protein
LRKANELFAAYFVTTHLPVPGDGPNYHVVDICRFCIGGQTIDFEVSSLGAARWTAADGGGVISDSSDRRLKLGWPVRMRGSSALPIIGAASVK